MKEQKTKWPELRWDEVVDRVLPLVYRVYAGNFVGTAFIVSIARSLPKGYYGAIFATALHVLVPAAQAGDSIALVSEDHSKRFTSQEDDIRVQPLGDTVHDTVLLMVVSRKMVVEESELLPMLPWESMLARGADIGWLGFPDVFEPEVCFFHGHVSGYQHKPPTYLVDGVAIGGVSGGPAFDNRAHIIGLVSAYIPNRVDGTTILPGVLALVPINTIRYFMQENMRATVL
ncbi:MAG: trypsin-like peptidase domain-containing protein [Acidobacteria bacterium]|nr:trypsin-like peptidase domain-containing protein [Acidobacteriota bacterium]